MLGLDHLADNDGRVGGDTMNVAFGAKTAWEAAGGLARR